MAYCLPHFAAQIFKGKLISGEINPEKLSMMSSPERRTFFASFLGENNAKNVNTLFESKLLLKNQQKGMINWAKTVGGMKPEVERDFIAKVNRMTEVLTPVNERSFLEDLASHKLGIKNVTVEQTQKIAQLAEKVNETKAIMESGPRRMNGVATPAETTYGLARTEFSNYVSDLKLEASKLTGGERFKPSNTLRNIQDFTGTIKASAASTDNSAVFRQGWKVLMTDTKIWSKNAIESIGNITRQIGGEEVMNRVKASIVSHPLYDNAVKAKLALFNVEEAFPTHILEKIPALGRLYKSSQTAYEAFMYKTRMDVFEKYYNIAKKSGIDVSDVKELEGMGNVINSLTGRGKLGQFEGAANLVNNVFFSPRNVLSNIDFLTVHAMRTGITPFARKMAAKNLAKVILGSSAIAAIADQLIPGSVETNPLSADFGNVRIFNTRFNISGGLGSYVTFAARQIMGKSKSSTTGRTTELNTGKFGSPTRISVIGNFAANKLSPLASIFYHIYGTGQRFEGGKATWRTEIFNILPLSPKGLTEDLIYMYQNPDTEDKAVRIVAGMLEFVGIGTNTYSKKR